MEHHFRGAPYILSFYLLKEKVVVMYLDYCNATPKQGTLQHFSFLYLFCKPKIDVIFEKKDA